MSMANIFVSQATARGSFSRSRRDLMPNRFRMKPSGRKQLQSEAALRGLSDHTLRDIGLNRSQIGSMAFEGVVQGNRS